MTTSKQQKLVVNLYRHLLKRCREIPTNRDLSHLHQRVENVPIGTSKDLRQALQQSFHKSHVGSKEHVQKALEGLRLLLSLDIDKLPILQLVDVGAIDAPSSKATSTAVVMSTHSKDWLEAVDWLPRMEDLKDRPYRPSDLPLFPMGGPLMPLRDLEGYPLPLFSQLTDIPVAGMEIPLKIFEPRYREMYKDVLSNGSKRFVVPVSHPYHAGRFARYGWIFEIVRVEDVADQTQGQIHLLAHHLVTRAVRIDTIVNPSDWATQSTYLRIQGEILEDTFAEMEDLNDIARTLRDLSASNNAYSSLAGRLLSGLAEGSIWSLVSIWMDWLQMEIIEIQVKIAAEIQMQAKLVGTGAVDTAMIQSAQAPFQEKLESLLMETSTLVPLLINESPKEQCARMHNRIRNRLLGN